MAIHPAATVVPTGVLPLRVQAVGGTHTDLGPGQPGSPVTPALAGRPPRTAAASPVRVAVNQDAGSVDYLREVTPGREGGAYIRAVPRPGGGGVITMTLPLLPSVDPADTATTLTEELTALVALVERR